jgi:hypothetical protein
MAQTTRAEATPEYGAWSAPKQPDHKTGAPGTFEPLPAGDRQSQARMAKSPYSVAKRILKSVCRELPRVALAA